MPSAWKFSFSCLVFGFFVLGAAGSAQAVTYNPLVTIDENGNGTLDFCGPGCPNPLPGSLQADPGPGGLSSALTYDLQGPPSLTAGDLLVYLNGNLDDVIRFNDYNTGGVSNYPASVVFYSNPVDGFDSLADAESPPATFYDNTISLDEIGGAVFYNPTSGEPGYVPGFDVAYEINSNVPEPLTLSLFGAGLAGAAAIRRRKKKASS